jgi:hypothetical protein
LSGEASVARLRSSARTSSRHGGNGALYGTGYQYKTADEEPIELGPWDQVWPKGDRGVPKSALQKLINAKLDDGVISPLWSEAIAESTSRTCCGAFTFRLANTKYSFLFWLDHSAGNVLKVDIYNGSATTTINTALTPGAVRICAAPWQDKLYFSYATATSLHKLDITGGTYAAVAAGPACEFLLVVDNNLVAIYQSGSTYVVKWSVDSSPEDWAGSGSGNNVVSHAYGRVQAFLPYNSDAMIICGAMAVQMSSTGVATPSAFRFSDRPEISGMAWTHAAASTGDRLFYYTQDRRLHVYDGNERPIGHANPQFTTAPELFYSDHLGWLAVTNTTLGESFFLNIHTFEWCGTKEYGWTYMHDVPASHALGQFRGIKNGASSNYTAYLYDLSPSTYTSPKFSTGRLRFGKEYWIQYIDVIRIGEAAPLPPTLTLRKEYGNGVIDEMEFSAQAATGLNERGTVIRYHISTPLERVELDFSADALYGPYLTGSTDADGNYPVDVTNPTTGLRSNTNADGNHAISGSATSWLGNSIDANGNLVLEAEAAVWTANSGIERIVIYVRELREATGAS